tara:strand:- start:935 stop:1036 length:102 start_codon:yes stop_codon:yes gene_type:complete
MLEGLELQKAKETEKKRSSGLRGRNLNFSKFNL